jgi:hypothetical protein
MPPYLMLEFSFSMSLLFLNLFKNVREVLPKDCLAYNEPTEVVYSNCSTHLFSLSILSHVSIAWHNVSPISVSSRLSLSRAFTHPRLF